MGNKSCLNCVFYAGASSTSPSTRALVTTSPAPVVATCSKLSSVLAFGEDVPGERAETIAGACDFFDASGAAGSRVLVAVSEAAPEGLVSSPFLRVAREPDPETPGAVFAPDGGVGSCASCANYVFGDDLEAAGALGWDSDVVPVNPSYCAAKGALVPLGEVGQASRVCGARASRSKGSVSFSSADLFAHIRDDLGVGETGAAAASAEPEVAPVHHDLSSIQAGSNKTGISSGSIQAGDDKTGICGQFRVYSDDRKRYVDLPVFDPDSFDAVERAKIPQAGDDAGPELFDDYGNLAYRVASAWALGETPALSGAPGLGKSQAAYFLAWKMGLPLERISITSASQLDDLAGYTELRRSEEGSVTEFVHGRVPSAWAKRCITLLDEPNTGPPEVWQFLRPLTDSAKQLVLDVNHGERVTRDAHSYLMLAMNPAWDYRNTGVAQLSDADGRRLVHVLVSPPDADREAKIIRAHMDAYGLALDDKKLSSLVAIGQELRSLADSEGGAGSLHITWGLAQQVKVAKLLGFFDFGEAFRLAGANNLDPVQRELILGVVNRLSPSTTQVRRSRRGSRSE